MEPRRLIWDDSWALLRDWPDQVQQVARLNLSLWGGDPREDLVKSSGRNDLVVFRLSTSNPIRKPWVIVRHPLWLALGAGPGSAGRV